MSALATCIDHICYRKTDTRTTSHFFSGFNLCLYHCHHWSVFFCLHLYRGPNRVNTDSQFVCSSSRFFSFSFMCETLSITVPICEVCPKFPGSVFTPPHLASIRFTWLGIPQCISPQPTGAATVGEGVDFKGWTPEVHKSLSHTVTWEPARYSRHSWSGRGMGFRWVGLGELFTHVPWPQSSVNAPVPSFT